MWKLHGIFEARRWGASALRAPAMVLGMGGFGDDVVDIPDWFLAEQGTLLSPLAI